MCANVLTGIHCALRWHTVWSNYSSPCDPFGCFKSPSRHDFEWPPLVSSLFESFGLFPPQSPQDYIRDSDSVLFTKPTGSVKKAREGTYTRLGQTHTPAALREDKATALWCLCQPLCSLIGLAIMEYELFVHVCVSGSVGGSLCLGWVFSVYLYNALYVFSLCVYTIHC